MYNERFNPLTRIRSSLTDMNKVVDINDGHMFQSPHEDSFFSDERVANWYLVRKQEGFNPLTRIRSSLTDVVIAFAGGPGTFQSPHEDSFFSDTRHEL